MTHKIAIKRLTASDLTFFEWQFRHHNAGNQKAINLNADVFIDQLYPLLPTIVTEKGGKIPISIHIYGPGFDNEFSLQRKIIKFGSYKNWRLNGEFIYNPPDNSSRFNSLSPGDIAIFDFTGELYPVDAKIVLIARAISQDQSLHEVFDQILDVKKMVAITRLVLKELITKAGVQEEHPINELIMDVVLEDAALGGCDGARRLFSRPSGRKTSQEELKEARKNADATGRLGEEYIYNYLAGLKKQNLIENFEWVSDINAVSPYDFSIEQDGKKIFVDVKTTRGDFDNVIHVSLNEIRQMICENNYELYRVYGIDEGSPKLSISSDLNIIKNLFNIIEKNMPKGISPDSFSISTSVLNFKTPIILECNDESEDE